MPTTHRAALLHNLLSDLVRGPDNEIVTVYLKSGSSLGCVEDGIGSANLDPWVGGQQFCLGLRRTLRPIPGMCRIVTGKYVTTKSKMIG